MAVPPQVMYERISCLAQSLEALGYNLLFCLAGKAAGELLMHPGIKVIWVAAVHPSFQFTVGFRDMYTLVEVVDLIEAGGEAPTPERVLERLEIGRAAARLAGQCAGRIVGECAGLGGEWACNGALWPGGAQPVSQSRRQPVTQPACSWAP